MATVSFPGGYNLERRSVFSHKSNVAVDFMDDGSTRQRTLGDTPHVSIDCAFDYLTDSEKNTLVDFVVSNAANTITWTIDGTAYSGVFRGGPKLSMTGNRFNVRFTYYASAI